MRVSYPHAVYTRGAVALMFAAGVLGGYGIDAAWTEPVWISGFWLLLSLLINVGVALWGRRRIGFGVSLAVMPAADDKPEGRPN